MDPGDYCRPILMLIDCNWLRVIIGSVPCAYKTLHYASTHAAFNLQSTNFDNTDKRLNERKIK